MNGPEWVVGFHPVLAAVEHQAGRVEVVLLLEGARGGRVQRVRETARRYGLRLREVNRQSLEEIAEGVAHNGFAARLAPVALAPAETILALPGRVCIVALDSPDDGRNVGAAVRVAAGMSLAGVVVTGPHPPPMGGALAKVAAGTLSMIPLVHAASLGDFARRAKGAGFWVVGADPSGERLDRFELPERLLLCLGREESGLRAKTRSALDAVVAIPLAPGVESLNLAVAAGILAWEWRRRFPLGE